MTLPSVLALNAWGTTPAQVHELIGGTTPNQIGNDITGVNAFALNPLGQSCFNCHAINFKGKDYCVTLSGTDVPQIRTKDQGGLDTWGVVHTLPAAMQFQNGSAGFFVVPEPSTGESFLVYAYSGVGTLRYAKSSDGVSWTSFSTGVAANADGRSIRFRNRLYVTNSNNATVIELDPIAETTTSITAPWNSFCLGMCVAFDRLFFIAAVNSSGNGQYYLYEFTGGGFSQLVQVGATNGYNTTSNNGMIGFFTDDVNMYAMVPVTDVLSASNGGSTCFQFVPSGGTFVVSEDPVTIPSGLRQGAPRGSVTTDRWLTFTDDNTDPENPAYYCVVAPGVAPGTGYEVYRWEGFGNEMGQGSVTGEIGPGASVSTNFSLPDHTDGIGRFLSAGVATYAEPLYGIAVAGAFRIYYQVWGFGGPYTGRVLVSTEQGVPQQVATLVGPTQQIPAVTGDGGATVRFVEIDLAASGVGDPDASTWSMDLR